MCQSLLTGWSKEEKGVGQSEITRARLALGSFSPQAQEQFAELCRGHSSRTASLATTLWQHREYEKKQDVYFLGTYRLMCTQTVCSHCHYKWAHTSTVTLQVTAWSPNTSRDGGALSQQSTFLSDVSWNDCCLHIPSAFSYPCAPSLPEADTSPQNFCSSCQTSTLVSTNFTRFTISTAPVF